MTPEEFEKIAESCRLPGDKNQVVGVAKTDDGGFAGTAAAAYNQHEAEEYDVDLVDLIDDIVCNSNTTPNFDPTDTHCPESQRQLATLGLQSPPRGTSAHPSINQHEQPAANLDMNKEPAAEEEQARHQLAETQRKAAEAQRASQQLEEQKRQAAEEQVRRLEEEKKRKEAEDRARRQLQQQKRKAAEELAQKLKELQQKKEADDRARRQLEEQKRKQQAAQELAQKLKEQQQKKEAEDREEQKRKQRLEAEKKDAEERAARDQEQEKDDESETDDETPDTPAVKKVSQRSFQTQRPTFLYGAFLLTLEFHFVYPLKNNKKTKMEKENEVRISRITNGFVCPWRQQYMSQISLSLSSLFVKDGIRNCKHDHEIMSTYCQESNKKYFRADYQEKSRWYPRKCCGTNCNVVFNVKKAVSSSNPVHLCKNGKNTLHKCMQALCNSCYIKKFIMDEPKDDGNGGEKKRETRRKRTPTERGALHDSAKKARRSRSRNRN